LGEAVPDLSQRELKNRHGQKVEGAQTEGPVGGNSKRIVRVVLKWVRTRSRKA